MFSNFINYCHNNLGSFGIGLTTVVLGLTCSIPFLAPVISYTAPREAWQVYVVFLVMGLGFCLPFILPLHKLFPPPGAWLGYFEKASGVIMILFGLWLSLSLLPIGPPSTIFPAKPGITFVTATWCGNCMAAKLVIYSEPVQSRLKSINGQYVMLDWTNGDKSITAFLDKYGVQAVPFILATNKDGKQTAISGIPTQHEVLEALSSSVRN